MRVFNKTNQWYHFNIQRLLLWLHFKDSVWELGWNTKKEDYYYSTSLYFSRRRKRFIDYFQINEWTHLEGSWMTENAEVSSSTEVYQILWPVLFRIVCNVLIPYTLETILCHENTQLELKMKLDTWNMVKVRGVLEGVQVLRSFFE